LFPRNLTQTTIFTMLNHRGFSAWLVSDGQEMHENLVAVDDKNHRVSCWVASEPGRTFTVYWRDHGGKVDTCAYITLDGFVVPGRFLFGDGIACRQGVRTGNATERPFIFSKVDETRNETAAECAAKDVGMIILRIKRIERVGGRPSNTIQKVPNTNTGTRGPGEHCIAFGDEKEAFQQYSTTWSVRPYKTDKPSSDKPSTYVTFVFRYRSPEFLKVQGIISEIHNPSMPKRTQMRRVASAPPASNGPMTPSPSPSPSPRRQELNLSSSVMQALSLRPQRSRKAPEARRVMSLRGVPQNDRFPGQGLICFDHESLNAEEKGDTTHDDILEGPENVP